LRGSGLNQKKGAPRGCLLTQIVQLLQNIQLKDRTRSKFKYILDLIVDVLIFDLVLSHRNYTLLIITETICCFTFLY